MWLLGEKERQRAAQKNSERGGLQSNEHRHSGTVVVQTGLTCAMPIKTGIQFTFRQPAPRARLRQCGCACPTCPMPFLPELQDWAETKIDPGLSLRNSVSLAQELLDSLSGKAI